MKRIALILAAVSLLATGCHKREHVEFLANEGACAVFQDSFTQRGIRARHDAQPNVKCDLVEKEGATCSVNELGVPKVSDRLPFTGQFSWEQNVFIITGDYDVFKLRLLCNNPGDCYQLQVWNRTNNIGVGCDIRPSIQGQASRSSTANNKLETPRLDSKNNSFNL